jgi:hypothetical protein
MTLSFGLTVPPVCVRACVRACVRVCARVCLCVCVCAPSRQVREYLSSRKGQRLTVSELRQGMQANSDVTIKQVRVCVVCVHVCVHVCGGPRACV